jgi:hypothetical protein
MSQPWPLITPALFSHRPPPNREKREKGKNASAGFPSPGRGEGGGRGDRGEGFWAVERDGIEEAEK